MKFAVVKMFRFRPFRHLSGRWIKWTLSQVMLGAVFFGLGSHYAGEPGGNPAAVVAPLNVHHVFLIVIVVSAPKNQARRQAVRNTWLKQCGADKCRPLFVVGSKHLDEETLRDLRRDASEHGDLLILPSVEDSYASLTNKVLTAFATVDEEWDFNYLLKVDDDSFVNLPALTRELENSNYKDGLYWGYFDGRAPVFKNGKWAESNYKLCDRYLPYALGGGYVLSANLVNYLARNSDDLQQFLSEDVSVGTWLGSVGSVHRIHDSRFDTEWTSRGCSNNHLVTHKQSPKDMKLKQANLERSEYSQMCQRETRLRSSYEYNWSVPPSKCCQRT